MRTDFQAIYSGFARRIGIAPEVVNDYHKTNFDDLLVGNITSEQFWDAMKNAGGDPDRDYKKIWVEEGVKNREINADLFGYIGKLRKRYRIGALTNLTPMRALIDREMDLYSHFDYAILSCDAHLKKPDPAFYGLALAAAAAGPKEAIFVDDHVEYAAAAESMGLESIEYTYPDNIRLKEGFEKLGISVD